MMISERCTVEVHLNNVMMMMMMVDNVIWFVVNDLGKIYIFNGRIHTRYTVGDNLNYINLHANEVLNRI